MWALGFKPIMEAGEEVRMHPVAAQRMPTPKTECMDGLPRAWL